MWEKLLASLILCMADMISVKEYSNTLDSFFERNPEDEMLLELEYCSNDIEKSWKLLKECCFNSELKFNNTNFSKYLCENLEQFYNEPDLVLKDFTQKAYSVWEFLPGTVKFSGPLIELSYVKPPIKAKSEAWAKATYQSMFEYYRNGYDKNVKAQGSPLTINKFIQAEPGTVVLDWDKIERLLGFHLHKSIKDFYSRALCPKVKGCIDFSEKSFLISTGDKRFDSWFSFNHCEGRLEFVLYPVGCAERADRFLRDSFQNWTGGNDFGQRVMVGEFYTNIGNILILINNETGRAEWIDCGYGYFEDYKKNPHGVLAEESGELLEKLCRYQV